MGSSFRIGTYNIGAEFCDYNAACQQIDPINMNEGTQTEKERIKLDARFNSYPALQEKAATFLVDKADLQVLCLQEVKQNINDSPDKDRPLIKKLKERNFKIIYGASEWGDANPALAISQDRFENITPVFGNRDYVIAAATDKVTKLRFIFVSAHILPVTLDDGPVDKIDASRGDKQCEEIVQKLSKEKDTIDIVGADTNAVPEIWENRFKKFTDHQFTVIRTKNPTNVNPRGSFNFRELDYLFVRNQNKFEVEVNVGVEGPLFSLNPTFGLHGVINPSDHIPVTAIVRMNLIERSIGERFMHTIRKIITSIWEYFQRLFSRLLGK